MTKKKTLFLVGYAIVVSVVLLVVCGNPFASPGTPSSPPTSTSSPPATPADKTERVGGLDAQRYTSTKYGYTILYPKGWTVQAMPGDTLSIGTSTTNIYITPMIYSCEPLADFVSMMRSILEDNMGYEIVIRGDILGDESREVCMDANTSGDVLLSRLGVVLTEIRMYTKAKPCGLVIEVVLSCPAEDWEYRQYIFLDIVKSFRLLD